jgi:hypothetical protein
MMYLYDVIISGCYLYCDVICMMLTFMYNDVMMRIKVFLLYLFIKEQVFLYLIFGNSLFPYLNIKERMYSLFLGGDGFLDLSV